MKNIFYGILSILLMCTIACKKQNEDVDPQKNNPDIRSTTPCNFDGSKITANSTLDINCLWDLKGQTLTLPENVKIEFGGGDIINGGLKFSGGTIDGRLLSHTLTIEGEVKLKDPTFEFIATRWDIVEGTTTSDIALKNNTALERIMFFTKKLGANTFKIDHLDAYFEVSKVTSTTSNQNFYPALEAINIPSDFHLAMTDNTHLRVFPVKVPQNGKSSGTLLAIRDAENITVSGGHLHGDRDTRVYSPDDNVNDIEGSHLFTIRSGRNITLDGLNLLEGSVGGLNINSFGFSFNPDYNPTKSVVIKNCTFKNIRRMSIALTDGRDILIENNTFINTGVASDKSNGGEVGYAINIEPDRTRDNDGNLKEYQKAFDITIRKNKEMGSRVGSVTLTIGQNITVEDNDFETQMVYSFVSGTRIRNNRFKSPEAPKGKFAIFASGIGVTVFDNKIYDNEIKGFSTGIVAGTRDVEIYGNKVTEGETGILLNKTFNTRIYNNSIEVANRGINATNTHSDRVEIRNNTIKSEQFHLYFANVNKGAQYQNYTLVVEENKFITPDKRVILSNTIGVTLRNNEIAGGVGVTNVNQVTISGNTIIPQNSDGIRLYNAHTTVVVTDNKISKPIGSRYQCINNESSSPQQVTMANNTCN